MNEEEKKKIVDKFKDNSGGAFPVAVPSGGFVPGLTKREWLAAQLLQAIIIGSASHENQYRDEISFWNFRNDGGGCTMECYRTMSDGKKRRMTIAEYWCLEARDMADELLCELNRD